ncbi:hypothetical protein CKO42_17425 [Lamprobacter modestohalophilus]|uniref:Uncharacterized protein n=1 Tax=Lamprobacter modestohalophilus TaxID=1064514 RepID=A0A9X1B577_9GAMM|nr:hypothetical protein [Lamprobacter modestohalophilus]MBK1620188.1 hypothetical protein [Lamprobacter modestohalophilus]
MTKQQRCLRATSTVALFLVGTVVTLSAFAQPPQSGYGMGHPGMMDGGYGPGYGVQGPGEGMGNPSMMGGYGPGYDQGPGFGMGHPGMMGGPAPGYDQGQGFGQGRGFPQPR